MATRSTADIHRITLQRRPPLVRCTSAGTVQERWDGDHRSCGALVPPSAGKPCPSCGQVQIRAQAEAPGPGDLVIDYPAVIVDADSGEAVAVHWMGGESIATEIAKALRSVEWDDPPMKRANNAGRLSGMHVAHRVFGYTPPQPMRRRYGCSRSRFDTDYPAAMDLIGKFTVLAEWVFRTFAPDVHRRTGEVVRATIPDAWRIERTLWSSGIINHTAALPMHTDSGNIPGSWSAMLMCRRQVEGGVLHLVDYGCYFSVPHGSITIFDGQSVTHGVTPLEPKGPDASRYSLVSYAKSNMRQCAPCQEDEGRRAALAATAAEDARIRP